MSKLILTYLGHASFHTPHDSASHQSWLDQKNVSIKVGSVLHVEGEHEVWLDGQMEVGVEGQDSPLLTLAVRGVVRFESDEEVDEEEAADLALNSVFQKAIDSMNDMFTAARLDSPDLTLDQILDALAAEE